jgi:hypothetical protein
VKPVHIQLDARVDLAEANDWYEDRLPGLGGEFLSEFIATAAKISERPDSFPVALEDARKTMLDRFPYLVVFIEESDRIEILAVVHAHRNPNVWKRRVRKR